MTDIATLTARLEKGWNILWAMEQRSDIGEDYERWLKVWSNDDPPGLLQQYEQAMDSRDVVRVTIAPPVAAQGELLT